MEKHCCKTHIKDHKPTAFSFNGSLSPIIPMSPIIFAGIGEDIIQGDDGSDILYGGTGEDILHADDIQNITAALEADNGRNSRSSLLSSGADDDLIVGNTGQDTLLGGAGKDILIGSAGDDNLIGDSQLTQATINWNMQRNNYNLDLEDGLFSTLVSGDDAANTFSSDDVLEGGRISGGLALIAYSKSQKARPAPVCIIYEYNAVGVQ